MKTLIRVIIGLSVAIIGFYFLWVYPRWSVPVLTYHSFDDGRGQLSVTPENFERQMRYLKDKGFNVIPLDELVTGIKNKRKFKHNTVVITMDDGYENNFTYAYPVLKKYGFPATVFIITNYMGTAPGYLNWDEVKEMSKHKISIGGHTKNHVYLPAINKEDVLWDEIAGCKKAIEEHIGMPVDYFCFPFGGFTKELQMLVKRAGYKGACITNRGFDILNRYDVYELDRVSVRNSNPYFSFSNPFSAIRFRAKLSGYYNSFRRERHGD